ncbi:MAG: discoidin domain-containing protein [Spirochaetes bacterium]|nr:discoidin domain-containing protein [Spirochaetota bacterium]
MFFAAFSTASLAAAPNLASQSTFEEGLGGWKHFIPAESKDKGCAAATAPGGRSGQCLRLASTDFARHGVGSGIALQPGKQYRLSVWVKTAGAQVSSDQPGPLLRLAMRGKDKSKDSENRYLTLAGLTDQAGISRMKVPGLPRDWTLLEAVVKTPSDLGGGCSLDLFAWNLRGIALFDDLAVEEVPEGTAATPILAPTAASPNGAEEAETAAAFGFEKALWGKGLVLTNAPVKEGRTSGLWKDHGVNPEISCDRIPHDWSRVSALRFWCYSEKANQAPINVILLSKADAKVFSYFMGRFTVDFTGWKQLTLPLSRFSATRDPAGWRKIDGITFNAKGWGVEPAADTALRFDAMELVPGEAPKPPTAPGLTAKLPSAERAKELEGMLGEKPVAWGKPASDRKAWDPLATHPFFTAIVKEAEREAPKETPLLTEEMFTDFKTKGTRPQWERPHSARLNRAIAFALAECARPDGRYLPKLAAELEAILAEGTWCSPAHCGGDSEYFRGNKTSVDLAATARAWSLACIASWLGDRLPKGLPDRVRSEIARRVWNPYLAAVKAGKVPYGWAVGDNNWNAVCHGGLIGSALMLDPDRSERAWLLASAEAFLPHFIEGYGEDGTCFEGISYFDYGFGHFLSLSEIIRQATSGKLDYLAAPKIARMAAWPRRFEMVGGQYGAFGDQGLGARPGKAFMRPISIRLGFPDAAEALASEIPASIGHPLGNHLYHLGLFFFSPLPPVAGLPPVDLGHDLRDWFPDGNRWVGRPVGRAPTSLSFCFKAGVNAGGHEHLDNGSFVVACGGGTPILDPGMDHYTRDTFGPKRFESQLLNSYGHPVPYPAKTLQFHGREAKAPVVSIATNDSEDVVELDLRGSYEAPSLEKLTRTFRYLRKGSNAVLQVEDAFRFSGNEEFGTALITRSPHVELSPTQWIIGSGKAAVKVTAQAVGGTVALKREDLTRTHGAKGFSRLGFDFTRPLKEGKLTLLIETAQAPLPMRASKPAQTDRLVPKAYAASSHDGNEPANAGDGNLETRWSAEGEQWIAVDLGAPRTVRGVGLATMRGDNRASFFKALVSKDGGKWTVAGAFKTSGQTLEIEFFGFPPMEGVRWVRLLGTGNSESAWNSYTEVEVYGK